jgi:hypothetical protein
MANVNRDTVSRMEAGESTRGSSSGPVLALLSKLESERNPVAELPAGVPADVPADVSAPTLALVKDSPPLTAGQVRIEVRAPGSGVRIEVTGPMSHAGALEESVARLMRATRADVKP